MKTSLIIFVLGIIAAAVFLRLLRAGRLPTVPSLAALSKKDFLLTEAERSFYEVLLKAVSGDIAVFPKVRLADLVWIRSGTPHRQGLLNRVVAKHVDFLLCARPLLKPILAVELDDSSHEANRRRERDEVVNAVLRAAGLPLLRVPAKRAYQPGDIAELIRLKISP